MKFHRVKLENLNSLYGSQTIDFEEDIRNSPLFLIIGPTGAGKSTILDAICLGLFGQTPRLERKTGKSDTDVAHIMSIGTASAYAEVEFSVLIGDGDRARYLASWSARRAYDDPEGAVQRPERSLYRKFPDGKMQLIVSDHREKYYQDQFDDALQGLSVDDFKRSILLAQGEFSAFLRASDQDKASILERLTNTDEYRRIGERASRRRRKVESRYRTLMMRLEEMQVLTLPQETELKAALADATKRLATARAELKTATRKVEWLQKLEELEERLENAEEGVEKAVGRQEERKDDYQRLERDAQLHEVEPVWRELERQQQTSKSIAEALGPLTEEIERLSERRDKLTGEVQAAEKNVASHRKVLQEAEPSIRKALKLRTQREAAQREVDSAATVQQKRSDALEKLKEELKEKKEAASQAEKAHQELDVRREELKTARPLIDRLPALRSTYQEGVLPLRSRLEELEREHEELKAKLEENSKELSKFDEELKESAKQRSAFQGQVTRTRNKLNALLEGRGELRHAIDKLTRENDAASTRAEALRESKYLFQRIAEQESERDEVFDRLTNVQQEVDALAEEQAQVKELESAQRSLVRQCEESLRQNERLLALSQYRQELDSGEPCPLCGSPVHPYCDSDELEEVDDRAQADRERLETELTSAREKLRATNEKLQRLASKFVARKTALRHDESRIVALRTALEDDQAAFSKSAEKAGYSPLETFRLKDQEMLESELAAALQRANETRELLSQIEQARQQLQQAETKHDAANARRRDVEEATDLLKTTKRQLEDRRKTRVSDLEKTRKEIARREEAIIEELTRLGVDSADDEREAREDGEDKADDLTEQMLAEASQVRAEVVALDEKLDASKREVERANADRERVQERCETATEALEAAQKSVHERTEIVTELDESITECLDGEDPDEARKRLEKALSEAREALDAKKTVKAENSEKLSTAMARKSDLKERAEKSSAATKEANEKLEATLKRLEIARSDVEAHLLDAPERKRLRVELAALDQETTRARTRLGDAKKQLERHTEEPLAASEETLEEAVADRTEFDERTNVVAQELGAYRERWETHEQTKNRRAEIEEELAEVQHELDVWNTVYGLIGVRDGEKFKLFAQSLNLQGLVDRANHRLEKLHPRYRLCVARGDGGEPTLSFMVQDRYQANVERPLTTLSGGETFLVSLALALGLADFRRIDMPIETLLLDEGFGTLDQDSLHLALNTLHQLHRDGSRQIGIISHVDALKELIDARVVVEPRGHGRSQIRFEFGADESNPLQVVK